MGEASPRLAGGPSLDAHAHVFTAAMPFAPGAHSHPPRAYPVEAWLADMAAHGVTHGVIAAASLFADRDRYTLDVLARHPQLRATVLPSPTDDSARLHDLREAGVVGVRLVWRRLPAVPDLTAEPWRSYLWRLAAAGLHVELLVGAARLPAILAALCDAGVAVVIDHFGAPSGDAAQDATAIAAIAAAGPRCRVKLSAAFRLDAALAATAAARLLADVGPERLLWGSDAPFVGHEDAVAYAGAIALYRRMVPDAAMRDAIDRAGLAFYFNERDAA